MDGVEDASKETLRYDSCSGAYIKLGAASVWGCFNLYLTRLLFGVRVHPTEFPFKSLRVSDTKRLYLVNRR